MSTKKLKYYLFILGCQMNKSDAERLETLLQSLGYEKTEKEEKADLIGVVACAVRQAPMDKIYSKAHKWNLLKEKRPLVTLLTGCVLKHDKNKLKYKFDILLDIKDIQKLPALLKKRNAELGDFIPSAAYMQIKPAYESSYKAYIPIMTGCNKFCTYCAVPYTRGPEVSRPTKDIIDEIKHLLGKGYKEITLLGQNVNSYGLDVIDKRSPNFGKKMPSFAKLLDKINKLPGKFWIRFLTSHPYDMPDELIKVMAKRGHLAEYLHLPVQSGSDKILKKMNRHYTVKHYLERLQKVRNAIPEISVSTDIIVGFCTEIAKDFEKTADLMEQVAFDMAYISQYSVRPGTGASRAFPDDIPKDVKKNRDKILNNILKKTALAYNQKFIGKTIEVLVDGIKNVHKSNLGEPLSRTYGKNMLYGKNRQFKTVQFSGPKKLIGQFVKIKITDVTAWGLNGKLIK